MLAYESDLRHWGRYAESRKFRKPYMPVKPENLRAYIAAMDDEGLSVATIRRRCSAIARWHRNNDIMSPTDHSRVKEAMRGLVRTRGSRPTKKKALTGDLVGRAMCDRRTSVRDKAVLSVGYATSRRRSELVSMLWNDITEQPEGFEILIRSSKTDKAGEGELTAVLRGSDPDTCPVRALEAWKAECRRTNKRESRIFPLSGRTIANIVKLAAKRAGLDPDEYGAHSLRRGHITNSARAGVARHDSMSATGHRSGKVHDGYTEGLRALRNPSFRAAVDSITRPKKADDVVTRSKK